ncbi:MAG TPA: discoidin domain-containing protein [Thermoanaerobaculia bacterium]|nr:discoidin domain-containing protein [Thermoanaerobaculia bacterium]
MLATLLLGGAASAPAPRLLDDFENASSWKSAPSDGVSLDLSSAEGLHGKALRLDFDFHGGAGYAVARKELAFELPENYELSFRVRGEAPVNNFEFKLIDPTGDNVWWVNRKNFTFPCEWTEVRYKKRHIQFAWGPAGGGEVHQVAALEFAVTAGTGGKGTILLDELTLRELPPEHPYDRMPEVTATPGGISLDFLESREYGGLVIDWGSGSWAGRYEVQISGDGATWTTIHTVDGGNGGRDYLYLPETESRFLRLHFLEGTGTPKIDVKPLDWAATPEAFFTALAKDDPRGAYPRWLTGEQSYWTVVGVPRDTAEGLFNEDGMLESGKGGFSIEPFLAQDGRLVTWNDAKTTPSLADGYLPIPSVTWEKGDLSLRITAFATGEAGASVLRARYRLHNQGKTESRPRLYLAIRPFQVNPAWQFLGNPPGGVSPIREIAANGRTVTINGEKKVTFSAEPAGFGAATFDQGVITDFLAQGNLPERSKVTDSFGYASAAARWDFRLQPGETKEVEVAIPLHSPARPSPPQSPSPTRTHTHPGEGEAGPGRETREGAPLARAGVSADGRGDGGEGRVGEAWHATLDRVDLRIPAAEPLVRTLKSNLAYILINQDGPGIQPGSRSYERSWIRDGALTSTALLRLGHFEEVRAFLAWYAPYQFANGKVPCCVDSRGADPVPENDSHGELLHLAAEYYRFTGDRELIERLWPHIEKAVGYIDELRQERRTAEYRTPDKLPYFGLLPESISHEGYSDKPVHSYWDDFFALRGLEDAADLAGSLGRTDQATLWGAIRDQFRADLLTSVRRTIELHKLDYIPASVEKGDFDPTSTSIDIAPGGELEGLPQTELRQTFERYYRESIARRDGTRDWDAYTPYELRTLRTLLRLGWRDRAHELLAFFMTDRRPAAWNQWAEVVWRDPRTPKFIGDMPHTWVGSEFIHSFLDLLAYVREGDGALILGAGLPPNWNSVSVKGLRTEYGPLEYSVTPEGNGVRYRIAAGLTMPPGGIIVHWQDKEAAVHELPATVDLLP